MIVGWEIGPVFGPYPRDTFSGTRDLWAVASAGGVANSDSAIRSRSLPECELLRTIE